MQSTLVLGRAALALLVAFGAGGAGAARSVAAMDECSALPASRQGTYHRTVTNDGWRVTFAQCTFTAVQSGRPESAGAYTIPSGDETSGRLTFSDDSACRTRGNQDVPTTYLYRFEGTRLFLEVEGGREVDLCPSRSSVLTPYPWTRTINGAVKIVYDRVGTRDRGTYRASGVVREAGTYAGKTIRRNGALVRKVTLRSAHGTIVFEERARGRRGTWSVTGGTGDYSGVYGGGSESRQVTGTRVHVVMTGRLTT